MNQVTKEADAHFKLDKRLKADCEFVGNIGVQLIINEQCQCTVVYFGTSGGGRY